MRHITGSAYERATHHGVGVRACDTPRGRRPERATHHGVAVRACDTSRGRRTSVRHITGSAYEKRASGREQRRERDVSMRNMVRDNYVNSLCISCDLYALGSVYYEINRVVDFMRRASQFLAYRRDVVLGVVHNCQHLPISTESTNLGEGGGLR